MAVSRRFRAAGRSLRARSNRTERRLPIGVFGKLAKLNKDDPNPHWLDVLLFHSHPPVAERIGDGGRGERGEGEGIVSRLRGLAN